MADSTGMADLRAENISKIVTGFALQNYKLKQLCMINSSSAWIESYFRETATELTGGAGSAVKGIPRLANFPYGEVSWTKVSSYIQKYGMEGVISYEDAKTNNIDVIARSLLRIGRAVAYAVDTEIEAVMAGAGNTFALTAGYEWDSATIANRDPIGDILKAKRYLADDNYDPDSNGYLVVTPKQYQYLLGNSKVVNNPSFKSADVVTNGVVGQICGLKIIVTPAVTADQCYVVIAKEALTWKQVAPLSVVTIEDPGVKWTIRAFELGVCQIPNPNAVCKITNVEA